MTEVIGTVADLKCASLGQMVRSRLSMTQLHILWLLDHHGEMPMSKLAELLDVSMSNTTGLIDRMEEHGYIERVRSADDRRLVIVRPGEAGRRAIEENAASRRERIRAAIDRLAPESRANVLAAIREVRAALQAEHDPGAEHHHHFLGAAS